MEQNTLVSRINALLESAGPLQKEELVYIGEPGKDGYKELGKFTFKRLAFPELDALRLHSINDQGKFDKTLHAGNNARVVSAMLIDPDTGINIFTPEMVNEWPGYMVDAFAAAGNKANSLGTENARVVAKNSDETTGAGNS